MVLQFFAVAGCETQGAWAVSILVLLSRWWSEPQIDYSILLNSFWFLFENVSPFMAAGFYVRWMLSCFLVDGLHCWVRTHWHRRFPCRALQSAPSPDFTYTHLGFTCLILMVKYLSLVIDWDEESDWYAPSQHAVSPECSISAWGSVILCGKICFVCTWGIRYLSSFWSILNPVWHLLIYPEIILYSFPFLFSLWLETVLSWPRWTSIQGSFKIEFIHVLVSSAV